ncbi:transposase [Streptomyces albospinus]|uniref:transposase n=1 Tax=Streptomyces albospinus TaxID=285515 RepID=UPI0016710740
MPVGAQSGPGPIDRTRPGGKHHVLTDAQGIPLAVSLTGGNRNEVTQLMPLLNKVSPLPGASDVRVDSPRCRLRTGATTTTSTAGSCGPRASNP